MRLPQDLANLLAVAIRDVNLVPKWRAFLFGGKRGANRDLNRDGRNAAR